MRFVLDVIRALLRIIASILMLLAFFATGLLLNAVTSGYEKISQPLGKVWFEDDVLRPVLETSSLQLFQVFLERKLAMPFLWDPLMTAVLNWPTWLALGVAAVGSVIVSMLIFGFTKRRVEPEPQVFI